METTNEKKENIDPKPHICFTNCDFDTMVEIFFKKIKPMEGVVKYKMVGWEKFPSNLEEAKTLGLEWSKKFKLNNAYSGFAVRIYFHLLSKTVRFELKTKISNEQINLVLTDMVEDKILSNCYAKNKTYLFDCNKTEYFQNFNLELCKTKGKELAEKLELKYPENKFIVFLSLEKSSIQITSK